MGGFCTIKGKPFCIIDWKASNHERIESLKSCIGKMDLENIYIKPAIRNLLNRKRGGDAEKNALIEPANEA